MKTRGADKWVRVNSSAVRQVRYHGRRRALEVRFADGEPYEYADVPRSKYRALLAADSKGKFVNERIKPRHPFRKIFGEKLR